VALRGNDISRRGRRVVADVAATATARVVPVTASLRRPGGGAGRHEGGWFVFRPGPAGPRLKEFRHWVRREPGS